RRPQCAIVQARLVEKPRRDRLISSNWPNTGEPDRHKVPRNGAAIVLPNARPAKDHDMSQHLRGHLALIGMGLLTAGPSVAATPADPTDLAVSPTARWLQLAPAQQLAQRLDNSKLGTT